MNYCCYCSRAAKKYGTGESDPLKDPSDKPGNEENDDDDDDDEDEEEEEDRSPHRERERDPDRKDYFHKPAAV